MGYEDGFLKIGLRSSNSMNFMEFIAITSLVYEDSDLKEIINQLKYIKHERSIDFS